jgi:hypothetical protein
MAIPQAANMLLSFLGMESTFQVTVIHNAIG